MKRLYYNHVKWKNYLWSGVYHITLVTNTRGEHIFGHIVGDHEQDAHVEYNDLGKEVLTCVNAIPSYHPQENIVIEAVSVMPDHIHFVLHVVSTLHTTTFGKIINGVKIGINKAYRIAQLHRGGLLPSPSPIAQPHRGGHMRAVGDIPWQEREFLRGTGLMQQGFNCRILLPSASLSTMVNYVNDNPRRAWIKKHNRDLFTIKRGLKIPLPNRGIAQPQCGGLYPHTAQPHRGGHPPLPIPTAQPQCGGLEFSALGNLFLLDYPCKQVVECSRTISTDQLAAQLANAMNQAEQGAVTYTAAINDGERTIARNIREAGYPLVVLLKDGFPTAGSEHEKYYKPGGVYFDACAEGNLLLLEPTQATFIHPTVIHNTEADLQRKAEAKHHSWVPLPYDSLRYRYVALNNIAHLLCPMHA